MPLSEAFRTAVTPLYSPAMGTESIAELLYSLVRFTLPRRVLEIGSGYTTLFILQALADNVTAYHNNKRRLQLSARGQQDDFTALLIPDYYKSSYDPYLLSIDDFSHKQTTAHMVPAIAETLALSQYLRWCASDYTTAVSDMPDTYLEFDLVWLDCGNYEEYVSYMRTVWPRVNRDGGLFVLHSTETNFEAQAFIRLMKIRQATTDFRRFELCGLLEPHKWRQNSIAIFRVTEDLVDRFYSAKA